MSAEMLKRLREQRANTWEQAKDLNDRALAENRTFDATEQAAWDQVNADLSSFDQRIAQVEQETQRAAAAEERAEEIGPVDPKPTVTTDADRLRAIANGEIRSFEFRDLTVGTATAGGHTVPEGFYAQLQQHMIDNSAIRQTNVTVLTTDSGNDLPVPKTTTHPTAGIISEAASITESDPVFNQVVLGAFKYGFSTQISTELEQDTGIDLVGYLAQIGGQALANGSGAHFVTGTGSSQPNGVVTASTLGVTGATSTSGVFTADNLLDLYFSVIAPYRNNGTWMMSDDGMKVARKLKDSDNQYLWAPGLTAGEQSTLLGRPVVTDTNVADTGTGNKSVIFGDLSKYFIRDVRGVRVERSVDFAFQNDLVTWRFLFRTDGDLVDTTGAVKHFIGGAT